MFANMKTVSMGLRVPAELRKAVKMKAIEEGVTLSEWVQAALHKALREKGNQ
jgi:predicted HicB family RNase H-like nuclease